MTKFLVIISKWLFIVFNIFLFSNAAIKFPTITRNKEAVNKAFNELVKLNSQNTALRKTQQKLLPLFGAIKINEICDAKRNQKILLCGFFLLNKPYNLKLDFDDSTNVNCKTNKLTHINSYMCPCAVEATNENTEQRICYEISQGKDKESAIIYLQRGNDLFPDAAIQDMIETKQLEKMRKMGIISEEGKQYVHIIWDANAASRTSKELLNFVQISTTKDEAVKDHKVFRVCQMEPVQQLFLCFQIVTQYSFKKTLFNYHQPICEERLSKFFLLRCPPVTNLKEKYGSKRKAEITFYISDSPITTTMVIYCRFSETDVNLYPYALMDILDLDVLQELTKNPNKKN